jgi:hypothetical protein
MLEIVLIAVIILLIISILLAIFNRYLPKWFCDKMHWHLPPKLISSNGFQNKGTCPRCGKEIIQSSQGWF